MKPINTRLYKVWQELRKIEAVPKELLDELENIADSITKINNPYLPDDLKESIERYGIPQRIQGDKISILQKFNIDYEPDDLPKLTVEYVIMNNDYKGLE